MLGRPKAKRSMHALRVNKEAVDARSRGHDGRRSGCSKLPYTFVHTTNANSSMPAMVTSDPAIATGSSAILPAINA